MTTRTPLVIGADGLPQQLQSGDSLAGASAPVTGNATVDFGTGADTASVTVTDAAVTTSTQINVWIQGGDTTANNNARAHSFAALSLRFVATPGTGSFVIDAHSLITRARGQFKMRYQYQ